MKTFYIIFIFITFGINSYSQNINSAPGKTNKARISANKFKRKPVDKKGSVIDTIVQPRETITEKSLKGSSSEILTTDTSRRNITGKKTFVSGIHAAPNAEEKFDTVNVNPNINNDLNTSAATVTPVAAPNDTIFNDNVITDNSVNTNSGAVDRSGNAQFGQTNWGKSRSTVGESQWTIPPPITASFTKEFPTARNAIWSRNKQDTSLYSARYKSGDFWITSNYNASGQRLDMRSEVPLATLPQPVSEYVSKLSTNLRVTTVSKWEVLGKRDVYEIKTMAGKTFYVNSEGSDATY